MKYLFTILIAATFIFIKTTGSLTTGEDELVKVMRIDDSLISGYYHISFINSSFEEGILISERQELECVNTLKEGMTYSLPLKPLSTTEGIVNVAFRLYQNDIYLDGKLVFPTNTKVYISEGIQGVCLE